MNRPLWLAGIAASAGAGIIHLAHGPAHVIELGALGAGFYLAAALQLGWAGIAVATFGRTRIGTAPRRVAALATSGIAINGAILAAWAMSRIVGLPAGAVPWTAEAVGLGDGVSAILEGLLVVALVATQRGWATPGLPRAPRFATAAGAIAIMLIVTGTALAVGPSEAGHSHPPGYEPGASDATLESVEHEHDREPEDH